MICNKRTYLLSWIVLSPLLLTAACSGPAPTPVPLTAVAAPTVLVPFTPESGTPELPTLLPTVTSAPLPTITNAPPPTSPALPTTAALASPAPTLVPVTVTSSGNIPTVTRAPTRIITRAPATATMTVTPSALPAGQPSVVISALRVEPTTPKADTGPTFFATFQNRSSDNQGFDVCVEIWDPEKTKNSTGLTACKQTTMPPGSTEMQIGGWAPKGQGECKPFRARAIARDEEDNRTPFVQVNGQDLWVDFTVCP